MKKMKKMKGEIPENEWKEKSGNNPGFNFTKEFVEMLLQKDRNGLVLWLPENFENNNDSPKGHYRDPSKDSNSAKYVGILFCFFVF